MSKEELNILLKKFSQSYSQSYNLLLFNPRSVNRHCQSFTKEELAKIRFSQEYLSLLSYNEQAFTKTYQSLKHFYIQKEGKSKKSNLLEQNFLQFIFQSIFTQNQKKQIEKLVKKQFNCEQSQNNKRKSSKDKYESNNTLQILKHVLKIENKKKKQEEFEQFE